MYAPASRFQSKLKLFEADMQRLNETRVVQRGNPVDEMTSELLEFENERLFSDWLAAEMKTITWSKYRSKENKLFLSWLQ